MNATATSLPPGPRMPMPLQTLGWTARTMPFLEGAQAKYGDMWTMKLAQEGPWVMVSHPDVVKQVFKGDPEVFRAGEGNAILSPLVGHNSVLTLDGSAHMTQRKLMLPPFHGRRMQAYGELMRDIAQREVDSWPAGGSLTLWPRMQAITLEIILQAVFGLDEGPRLDALRTRLREVLAVSTAPVTMLLIAMLGTRRFERLKVVRRELDPADQLLYEQIRERREDPDLENRSDILSMLLSARYEDGEPMSDVELRDELVTLLVAGHETTATSLAWTMERLVRHPGALERLRDEVAAGEDEYMDAVVKETLRLRPVLPVVVRRLSRDTEVGGRLLPAGVAVAPCIHLVHRRPDVYPEPSRFRPERFLEQPAGTYTWIPFGGGVRRCLGASFALFEMKQVLTAMMSRIEPSSSATSERVIRRAITMSPSRGGEVTLAA
ncbi:MAG TPA: cytochrome P450 [Thermoleophilaceae bacterium]|nr:cytochrome P450 [Thermoleophilaceae bacterium]